MEDSQVQQMSNSQFIGVDLNEVAANVDEDDMDVMEVEAIDGDVREGEGKLLLTPVKKSEKKIPPPDVGMVFPTWEEVDNYFRSYGKQMGFGVVRASSGHVQGKSNTTKQRRNSTWTCESYGRPDRRPRKNKLNLATDSQVEDDLNSTRKSKKCDCPVLIYASMNEEEQWQIRRVMLEHKNHEPNPKQSRYIAMFRRDELTANVKRQLKFWDAGGAKIPQIHNILAKQRNGLQELGVSERDLRNERDKEKRLKMKDGDANAMLKYFDKMTADNQNFFHRYRVDEDSLLQDIMWVDARSKAAYLEFGDVVCFDATYLTNKYELPFANFVGVNHHGQSILLGCALISHENTETYEWLFSTWLHCMDGKAPGGILTDQAPAMRKALKSTIPQSRHRWCIWHITEKFSTKLRKYANYQEFKEILKNVIYDSLYPTDFEQNWGMFIEKYGLSADEWLAGLYKEREMWVPAYMKHMFWAGMKTTQRVESINSFFDDYVNNTTRLYQFAESYCEAMEVRAEAELEADANSSRFIRQLATSFPTEAVFQKVYTDAKFKEVQRECSRVLYCHCLGKKGNSIDNEYVVADKVWARDKDTKKEFVTNHRRNYVVRHDSLSNELLCDCKYFECHGIVCRHMVNVWDFLDILQVPESYILRRWRKDVRRKHTAVKVAYHDPSKTVQVKRFDSLQLDFDPICYKASQFDETLEVARELLQLMDIRVDEKTSMLQEGTTQDKICTPSSVCNNKHPANPGQLTTPASINNHVRLQDIHMNVKDPPNPNGAHRPKSKRLVSAVEKAVKLKKGSKSGKKGKAKQVAGKSNGKNKVNSSGKKNNCDSMVPKVGMKRTTAVDNVGNPLSIGGIEMLDEDGSIGYFSPVQKVLFSNDILVENGSTNAVGQSTAIDLQLTL